MSDPRTGQIVATLGVMIQHRQILTDLLHWEPVGSIAEDLRMAMHGAGGVDKPTIDRLNEWSTRWARLHPRARRFYCHAVESLAPDSPDRSRVERAIWRIVNNPDFAPDPQLNHQLQRLHRELVGIPCGFDLMPTETDR